MWQTCYHPTKQVDMHNGLGTWCPAFVCVCVCLVVCLGGGGGGGGGWEGGSGFFLYVFSCILRHAFYIQPHHTYMYVPVWFKK